MKIYLKLCKNPDLDNKKVTKQKSKILKMALFKLLKIWEIRSFSLLRKIIAFNEFQRSQIGFSFFALNFYRVVFILEKYSQEMINLLLYYVVRDF